jgi:hypothetical protein
MKMFRSLAAALLLPPVFAAHADAPKSAAPRLDFYTAPDGHAEAYYAGGDELLVASFELMTSYWNRIASTGLSQVRGHLDNYLPRELKALGHRPADAMMRTFAEAFFAARNPDTGLIPGTAESWHAQRLVNQKGKQPVYLVHKAAQLLEWFPEDEKLRAECVALAEATMKHFDFEDPPGKKRGMWGYADVKGGEARGPVTITLDYGAMAKGMAVVSQLSGDRRFMAWADQKLEFVWWARLNRDLPILSDVFVPYTAVMNDGWTSDTDTLYHVRLLYGIYALTGDTKYRDWALAATDLWFDRAWNSQWGHFIRKLRPDGTPAVETLYGDAKYNTLHMLVDAYRTNKNPKYAERLKFAWKNLLRMGIGGLVAESVRRGEPEVRQGFDPQQTIFIDILVDAYEATGDAEFLREAEAHASRVLRVGRKAMRIEGCQAGRALLRVALARSAVRRLELPLEARDTPVKITRQGKTALEATVPADLAVVYLPVGTYQVQTGAQSREVTLARDEASRPVADKRLAPSAAPAQK